MAKETIISDEAANAACNAITALLNGGKLRVYKNTKPTSTSDPVDPDDLLGENTLGSPAFGAASGGVATANAIAPSNAVATGDASFFRIFKSDGTTAVYDGTIGVGSDFNMQVNTVSISAGLSLEPQTVQIDVRNATTGY